MLTESIKESLGNWDELSNSMKARYRQLTREKTSKALEDLWKIMVNQHRLETEKSEPVMDDKAIYRLIEAWMYSESETVKEGSEAWGHSKKLRRLKSLVEEEDKAVGEVDYYELEEMRP